MQAFLATVCGIYLGVSLSRYIKTMSLSKHSSDPGLKRGVLQYCFFWPTFFLQVSPLIFFSETFFKHYGDEGVTYFGTKGLKNFLNDMVKGKNRYQSVKPIMKTFELGELKKIEEQASFGELQPPFAHIVCAPFKDGYLLSVLYVSEQNHEHPNPSRYELDDCEKCTFSELKETLISLNPTIGAAIIEDLTSQSSQSDVTS